MHPKVRQAFEEIDSALFNSDDFEDDYPFVVEFFARWRRKVKERGMVPAPADVAFADDSVQFPRLLAEIHAVGLTAKQIKDLSTSMDLSPSGIAEVLERAESEWDRIKWEHLNKEPVLMEEERLPGDTDGPRRRQDPMDYNRAQPTEDDMGMVRAFMDREFADAPTTKKEYFNCQVPRKFGLLAAMQFNRGFDAGVESVRDENGYSRGYNDALDLATTRLQGLERRKRTKKKSP